MFTQSSRHRCKLISNSRASVDIGVIAQPVRALTPHRSFHTCSFLGAACEAAAKCLVRIAPENVRFDQFLWTQPATTQVWRLLDSRGLFLTLTASRRYQSSYRTRFHTRPYGDLELNRLESSYCLNHDFYLNNVTLADLDLHSGYICIHTSSSKNRKLLACDIGHDRCCHCDGNHSRTLQRRLAQSCL